MSATFTDLANASWAKESIEALAARGILTGAGGAFNPSADITRADLMDMLIKAAGLSDETAICTFSDVQEGTPYYQSVAAAQKLGITMGTGSGKFGADDKLTRQDMAVWLYKISLLTEADLNADKEIAAFADRSDISSYAAEAVDEMVKAGLLSGMGNNAFQPRGHTTRAQSAVVAYFLFKLTK